MAQIPLSKDMFSTIDDEDLSLISSRKWYVVGPIRGIFYARTGRGANILYMHRLLMQAPKHVLIDHIDGDGLNNRRINLRPATHKENMRNSKKPVGCASQYKGVTWFKGRWKVTVNKQFVGYFDTEIEAARVYDASIREHFGEFARLNFPQQVAA
jgi:hypothetical protein